MSKLVSSFASVRNLATPDPVHLDFTRGWGVGPIFDWYHNLTHPLSKSIKKIQIWKYISKPVPHRFVVVHMSDGCIHRFDRRPDRTHVDANVVDLLSNQPVACQDAYELDISIKTVEKTAICEIELDLKNQVDIMTVISTCYAISLDDSAKQYSFLLYNCFFFAWTILMVAARRCLPYQLPVAANFMQRFYKDLDNITDFIVEESIGLFRDLVIEVLTIFRNKAGSRLHVGMNAMAKAAYALPTGVLRFLWRRLFDIRLHLGLRKELAAKVKREIVNTAELVQTAALAMQGARELLDEHLWIDDTKNPLENMIKEETVKVIWKSILEAISAGLGKLTPDELAAELSNSEIKFSILGRNAAQYTAVWNAGLHGGLQAAKDASQALEGLSHDKAFDRAWDAAREGALRSAKTVVDNTSKTMNKPHRDEMWQVVWDIWDDCWKEVHGIVQPRAVQTVERVVDKLISTGVLAVVQDMKQSRGQTIEARMPNKERKWLPSIYNHSGRGITNAELQDYMYNMIEQDTVSANTLKDVHVSMARVWKKTLQQSPVPMKVLQTIAE